MRALRWLMLLVRSVLGRGRLQRDMEDEMRAHLEQAEARLIERGLSPADARAEARREFGNVTVIQDDARAARGARWVDALSGDVRFALRHFARNPLTVAIIVTVLALGIGANTAIFLGLQAELFNPAPAVPKDASHIRIYGVEQASRGVRWRLRDLSAAELAGLAERRETFASIAGWVQHEAALEVLDSSTARSVGIEFVTPNYLATLGVRLIAGPGFALDTTVADLAAVLSYKEANDAFGSAAAAVGKRIKVNETYLRVVGVAPELFQGAVPNSPRTTVWMPISARAQVARLPVRWIDGSELTVFGRLAPGVTREAATRTARAVTSQLLPDSLARLGAERGAEVVALRALPPLYATGDPSDRIVYAAMWIIGVLILLVACTNVASLMVASGVGRRQEIAVRLALGASRGRIVRQLVTESGLLALAGGALGFLLLWWLSTIIETQVNVRLTPDVTTMVFTVVFAVGTGLVFGLSPALHATRDAVSAAMRDSGAGATRRSRLQRGFVVAQLAMSQPLLVLLAVLLFAARTEQTPVEDTLAAQLISARFNPEARAGTAEQRHLIVDSLVRHISAWPAALSVVPESEGFALWRIRPFESHRDTIGVAELTRVQGTHPGYFGILDVPIMLGRDVSMEDTASSEYNIVVGSDLARRFWGDANPIGRTVMATTRVDGRPDSIAVHVVGVFDATRPTTLGYGSRVFTARGQHWKRDALLIRTRGPAQAALAQLRELVRDRAPGLPVLALETQTSVNDRDKRVEWQVTGLAVSAAALALAVASLGLYGVVALAVTQRKREIGIRIAVGGRPMQVVRMFFRSGVWLSALGLLIGLPVSLALLKLALSVGLVLVAKAPNIPLTGLAIAAVLLAVSSAATWFPARRAAHVDPVQTLRVE